MFDINDIDWTEEINGYPQREELIDNATQILQEFHFYLEKSELDEDSRINFVSLATETVNLDLMRNSKIIDNDFLKFLNFSITNEHYLTLDTRSVYLDNPEKDIYELSFKIISFLLKKADLDLEALLLVTKTRRSWISIGGNKKFILWESSSRAKQNFTQNSEKIAGVCNYILYQYHSQYRVFIHLIPETNLLCYRLLTQDEVSSQINYYKDKNKNDSYWQRCFMYLPQPGQTSDELLDINFSDAQYELVEAK